MKSWPEGGPQRLWMFEDAGYGYAGFSSSMACSSRWVAAPRRMVKRKTKSKAKSKSRRTTTRKTPRRTTTQAEDEEKE